MRWLVLASAVAVGACSTIVKGTDQDIALITPYAEGAECRLEDGKGAEYFVKATPATVRVNRGDGPLSVRCEKDEFKTAALVVEEAFEPWTLGNVLLGGVIGIGIDAASGALQKYPPEIKVYMEPLVFGSAAEREQWLAEKNEYEASLESAPQAEE